MPAEGNTRFLDVQAFVGTFSYALARVSDPFLNAKGCPEFKLLQERHHLLVIEVVVEDTDGTAALRPDDTLARLHGRHAARQHGA